MDVRASQAILIDIFERIEIVAKHENTSIELSGSGIERVGILEKAVKEIGADRVLYGSDFTINDPAAVIAFLRCWTQGYAMNVPLKRRRSACGFGNPP